MTIADFGLDLDRWRGEQARLTASFRAGAPVPCAVLDDALRLPPSVVADFPAPDWPDWVSRDDTYQRAKVACRELSALPSPWRELALGFSQAPMLRLLEAITGIEGLIADPYLSGGGLSYSGPGGTLTAHTDHHVYPHLGLYRRLNLLVYLNPAWAPGDGGELALWRRDAPERRLVVEPVWGRVVLFQTDNRSVHGFLNPVAEGRIRRSLALYYYTSAEAPVFSGDAWTRWFDDEPGSGPTARARALACRGLLRLAEGCAAAAHLLNPRRGPGWLAARRNQRTSSP